MTHFLVTDENPSGHRLEDILLMIRKDILTRAVNIADDRLVEEAADLVYHLYVLLAARGIDLAQCEDVLASRAS